MSYSPMDAEDDSPYTPPCRPPRCSPPIARFMTSYPKTIPFTIDKKVKPLSRDPAALSQRPPVLDTIRTGIALGERLPPLLQHDITRPTVLLGVERLPSTHPEYFGPGLGKVYAHRDERADPVAHEVDSFTSAETWESDFEWQQMKQHARSPYVVDTAIRLLHVIGTSRKDSFSILEPSHYYARQKSDNKEAFGLGTLARKLDYWSQKHGAGVRMGVNHLAFVNITADQTVISSLPVTWNLPYAQFENRNRRNSMENYYNNLGGETQITLSSGWVPDDRGIVSPWIWFTISLPLINRGPDNAPLPFPGGLSPQSSVTIAAPRANLSVLGPADRLDLGVFRGGADGPGQRLRLVFSSNGRPAVEFSHNLGTLSCGPRKTPAMCADFLSADFAAPYPGMRVPPPAPAAHFYDDGDENDDDDDDDDEDEEDYYEPPRDAAEARARKQSRLAWWDGLRAAANYDAYRWGWLGTLMGSGDLLVDMVADADIVAAFLGPQVAANGVATAAAAAVSEEQIGTQQHAPAMQTAPQGQAPPSHPIHTRGPQQWADGQAATSSRHVAQSTRTTQGPLAPSGLRNEMLANETEANETEANEMEANEMEANEMEANEMEVIDLD